MHAYTQILAVAVFRSLYYISKNVMILGCLAQSELFVCNRQHWTQCLQNTRKDTLYIVATNTLKIVMHISLEHHHVTLKQLIMCDGV